jgi:hypothetical protein
MQPEAPHPRLIVVASIFKANSNASRPADVISLSSVA